MDCFILVSVDDTTGFGKIISEPCQTEADDALFAFEEYNTVYQKCKNLNEVCVFIIRLLKIQSNARSKN